MKIKELRALRGPNYYHRLPVIFLRVELQELEYRPSDLVDGCLERLAQMMPSLQEHTCSPGVIGGFFQRITRGTWAGHVAEHVAIELQRLIGHDVTFGKTITKSHKGQYDIVFRYREEEVGLRAAEMAVELTKRLFHGETTPVEDLIKELNQINDRARFGPSTQSIVDEAKKRGIPYIRRNQHSYVQFGQGKYQRRIQATVMDSTSSIGVEIAADKNRTKQILQAQGILVPQGERVQSLDEALKVVEKIGYPVVVKPLSGNHGRGVTTNISSDIDLALALEGALTIHDQALVETFIPGNDYRLLVINGKLEAAALREPAKIIGDGRKTIEELIQEMNLDPERGNGHEKNLTLIKIDDETQRALEKQHLGLQSIPSTGQTIFVKETANLSTGGTATDVTDVLHPSIKFMAERMSGIIGLDVMGIDLMADRIDVPLRPGRAAVVEVNAGPGFRMHLHPTKGQARNVAQPVMDMLFPPGTRHSLPIVAVTGTNGKTTTTRLIAQIIRTAGRVVGMTSTDAVEINRVKILRGDYSGPAGAEAVLTDSTTEYAVLEVARGGILRRGLGFAWCDVGVLLNVTSDHLGLGGVETLEQLARTKATVTSAVRKTGFAVFNADDALVLEQVRHTKGQPILFSLNPEHYALQENLKNGYFNVSVRGHQLVVQRPSGETVIGDVEDYPITFSGKALFNVENVLAATAATLGLKFSEDQIHDGLKSFYPSLDQSPGRMNLIEIDGFKALIDYGHNVAALEKTKDFITSLMPGRIIRTAAGVGDRRTEDILQFGRLLATQSDLIVICDPSPRTRALGETAELIKQGLLEGGLLEEQIFIALKEQDATQIALNLAKEGDLVVLQVENIEQVTQDVLEFKKRIES